MSVYDRDYFRNRWDGRGSPLSRWGVTEWLIALNVLAFVAELGGLPIRLLALYPGDVLYRHRYWQPLTHAFLHAGPWHLLFNMLFLWWFGRELEGIYGRWRYLRFYLVSGIVAGLAFVAGAWYQGLPHPAIGASGAVMGVTVLYAFHYPRQRVLFYGIIPVEIRWLVVFYAIADLSGWVGGGTGVANAAHLGGAACGAAYALWQRRR